MVYKQHNNGSYNIHTIKTDRFKNIKMEIFFRNNIDPQNIHKRAMLFDVLVETSTKYPTKRDLTLALEELYNANLYATSIKVGKQIISSISMDFLNPKYTEDFNIEDAIRLPFELIFNPDVKNEEFKRSTLETIRTRMIADIESLKENPRRYALMEALKSFDEKSISAINIMGNVDDLNLITPHNLYETYQEIIDHDYIDIFIIGDIDEHQVVDIISKYAKFTTIKNHPLEMNINNKVRSKINEVMVPSNNAQAQIVYILNTLNLSDEEKKYPFMIYNMILGGGSLETKLYQNLRDKNSLCYNVNSMFQKFDNLEIISTAVDNENIKLTCKLINNTLKEMEHKVSDDEVRRAVSAIISSIKMSLDVPGRIIDMYLFEYMGSIDNIDERIKKFKEITKNDVMKMARKVKVNTVYVMKGDEDNGKDQTK